MKAILRPPFPFFDIWERGGYAHAVGTKASCGRWRWRSWGSGIGVIAWPIRRRRKRWRDRCGVGGSCRRWWRACASEKLELLDGFKRLAAARQVARVDELERARAGSGRADGQGGDPGAEPRTSVPVRELEEAWIVQGLVRDDGMTQVEAAHLLGRHKSWVCRRLALLEKLSVAVKEDLRLGLVGPSLARQLTRLPAGNQEAVLALTRRETLTAQEVSGVIDLLQGASAGAGGVRAGQAA